MLQYPATIKKRAGSYLVSFSDFENINTWGETLEKALESAEEALSGCLESDFERGLHHPGAIREKRPHRALYPRTTAYSRCAYAAKNAGGP